MAIKLELGRSHLKRKTSETNKLKAKMQDKIKLNQINTA